MPFHDALAPLRNLKHQVYSNPSKKRSSTGVSPSSASTLTSSSSSSNSIYPSNPSSASLLSVDSASASSSSASLDNNSSAASSSSSHSTLTATVSSSTSLRPRPTAGPKRTSTRSKTAAVIASIQPVPSSSASAPSYFLQPATSSSSSIASSSSTPLTPATTSAARATERLSKEYRAKAALIQQEEWKKALKREGSINGGGAAGSGKSRILFEDEYKEDVLIYMRRMERATQPSVKLMEMQPELEWYMRPFLVEFLVEIHQQCRLRPEVLYLTINLVDRYVSKRIVYKKHYQLVGCSALWLAAKFEESKDRVPTVETLCELCCHAYDASAFIQMEGHVLSTIGWSLGHPTAEAWLRLSCLGTANGDPESMAVAQFLMEITLWHKEFVSYLPSTIAAGSLLLAKYLLDRPRRCVDEYEAALEVAFLLDGHLGEGVQQISEILRTKYAQGWYYHASRTVAEAYLRGRRFEVVVPLPAPAPPSSMIASSASSSSAVVRPSSHLTPPTNPSSSSSTAAMTTPSASSSTTSFASANGNSSSDPSSANNTTIPTVPSTSIPTTSSSTTLALPSSHSRPRLGPLSAFPPSRSTSSNSLASSSTSSSPRRSVSSSASCSSYGSDTDMPDTPTTNCPTFAASSSSFHLGVPGSSSSSSVGSSGEGGVSASGRVHVLPAGTAAAVAGGGGGGGLKGGAAGGGVGVGVGVGGAGSIGPGKPDGSSIGGEGGGATGQMMMEGGKAEFVVQQPRAVFAPLDNARALPSFSRQRHGLNRRLSG